MKFMLDTKICGSKNLPKKVTGYFLKVKIYPFDMPG